MNLKLILVLLLISSCSSTKNISNSRNDSSITKADYLINIDSFPPAYKEALAREREIQQQSFLKLEELNINKEVIGKISLIDKNENAWYYHIDIGTDVPVECYVLTEYDGPSNGFHNIIEAALEGVTELYKLPLSSKQNFSIGSGAIKRAPYLLLNTLYTLGSGDKAVSGILKGLSAETNNSLKSCIHNEVGYQKAFFTVFESFVNAFVLNDTPDYESIYQVKINDISSGYMQEKYIKDDEGDINIKAGIVLMLPVNAESIMRSDTYSSSWSNNDGSLINAYEASIENSILTSSLSLEDNGKKWLLKGELQDKSIDTELQYDDWLLSEYGIYLEIVDLIKSEKKSAKYYSWTSFSDPTSPVSIEISKIENNPNANFKIKVGPQVMKVLVDKDGLKQKGVMEQGSVQMRLELIQVTGHPKDL